MLIVSNPPLVGVAAARTLIGPEVTGEIPQDVRVLDRARLVVTRDTAIVLDNNSLWRHFEVQRCAYVRTWNSGAKYAQPTPAGFPCSIRPRTRSAA
jgi:hypothetical protein